MKIDNWFALIALIVSVASLAITVFEKFRSEQEDIIKALQGEKENVAFTALKVNRQWVNSPFAELYKDDVIASLCLAWIMVSSDRARAMVLSALFKLNAEPDNKSRIKETLQNIQKQFVDYVNLAYSSNPAAGRKRIQRGVDKADQLRKALGI